MRKDKINFTVDNRKMSYNKMIMTLTRHEMEVSAIACNCFLKESVSEMTDITLLRNIHPLDRSQFAKRLYAKGILFKSALAEFSEID